MGSLDFKPTFIPGTITEFLGKVSRTVSQKILQLDDLVDRLETETRKIEAFQRELPLCMLLVKDAIAALKEESMAFKKSSSAGPVLEEFMPLNKSCDEDVKSEIIKNEKDNGDKKNWLSSTQLWNTNDSNPCSNQSHNQNHNSVEPTVRKRAAEEDPRIIHGFSVVNTTRKEDEEQMPVSGLSLIAPGTKNPARGIGLLTTTSADSRLVPCFTPNGQSNIRTNATQQTGRKQRRCWSTELHRRFVNALEQLGGSQVATPKQIRELMQVDGLTNDEVKSHLQKYRLHTRKLPSSNTSSTKHSHSQSGSPDGPLLLHRTSTTGGDSMYDGEDEKSENFCWNTHLRTSGKDEV